MIGTTLGAYRVIESIGEGGMGTVYLAQVQRAQADLSQGDSVAIKVVSSRGARWRDRFEREIRAGRRVDHPNLARLLDSGVGEVGGDAVHYLVMEYIEGTSASDACSGGGSVREGMAKHIGAAVARGLDALHAAGVVHRDVKPSNVMVTPRDEVKLVDLGVAYIAGPEPHCRETYPRGRVRRHACVRGSGEPGWVHGRTLRAKRSLLAGRDPAAPCPWPYTHSSGHSLRHRRPVWTGGSAPSIRAAR